MWLELELGIQIGRNPWRALVGHDSDDACGHRLFSMEMFIRSATTSTTLVVFWVKPLTAMCNKGAFNAVRFLKASCGRKLALGHCCDVVCCELDQEVVQCGIYRVGSGGARKS